MGADDGDVVSTDGGVEMRDGSVGVGEGLVDRVVRRANGSEVVGETPAVEHVVFEERRGIGSCGAERCEQGLDGFMDALELCEVLREGERRDGAGGDVFLERSALDRVVCIRRGIAELRGDRRCPGGVDGDVDVDDVGSSGGSIVRRDHDGFDLADWMKGMTGVGQQAVIIRISSSRIPRRR